MSDTQKTRVKYGGHWWRLIVDHGQSLYIERGPERAPSYGQWVHRECIAEFQTISERRARRQGKSHA